MLQPAPRSPGARAVPYGVTGSEGKGYSIVTPPMFTLRSRDTYSLPCDYRAGMKVGENTLGDMRGVLCEIFPKVDSAIILCILISIPLFVVNR